MQRRVVILSALVNTRAVRYQNANCLRVAPFRNDMQGDLTVKPCGIDRRHLNPKKDVSTIHLGEYLLQRLHASNDEVMRLTMRLSDAGLRRHKSKLIYLNHRPAPWLNEDDTRDRSNRLLDGDT